MPSLDLPQEWEAIESLVQKDDIIKVVFKKDQSVHV